MLRAETQRTTLTIEVRPREAHRFRVLAPIAGSESLLLAPAIQDVRVRSQRHGVPIATSPFVADRAVVRILVGRAKPYFSHTQSAEDRVVRGTVSPYDFDPVEGIPSMVVFEFRDQLIQAEIPS